MELMVKLEKGGVEKTVWVNGKWVQVPAPKGVEKREFSDEPNDTAITWSKELLGAGYSLSGLNVMDGSAKELAAVRESITFKSKKGPTGPTDSHTGGTPWLAKGEAWPLCQNCKRPMPLFLQLDLAGLKLPRKVKGLLQLFYCNSTEPLCEVDCETWKGAGGSMLLRVVMPEGKPAGVTPPEFPSPIAAKAIVPGPAKQDFPSPEDAETRYGVRNASDRSIRGDKLLGWSAWVQSPEWPECPDCGKQMEQLVQLESSKALEHQWGDMGRAHLFLCPDHPQRTGFVWAGG